MFLADRARPGDQILVMSNGGFDGLHDLLDETGRVVATIGALAMKAMAKKGMSCLLSVRPEVAKMFWQP